jgi:hypothetical protein
MDNLFFAGEYLEDVKVKMISIFSSSLWHQQLSFFLSFCHLFLNTHTGQIRTALRLSLFYLYVIGIHSTSLVPHRTRSPNKRSVTRKQLN